MHMYTAKYGESGLGRSVFIKNIVWESGTKDEEQGQKTKVQQPQGQREAKSGELGASLITPDIQESNGGRGSK